MVETIEAPFDLLVRDLVEALPFEVEVLVQQAPVAVGRARPVLLLALRHVEVAGRVPSDRAWSALAERPFRKEAFGLGAGLRKRDDGIAADAGEPSVGAVLDHKGLGAALRDAAAEAGQALVKIGPLSLLGTGQISYADVG